MRRLIWLIVLLVGVGSGWWVVTTFGAIRGIEAWLDARQSEGWQAETSAIGFEGYPLGVHLSLKDLILADPETGIALETSRLGLRAPVWDPGDVTLVLPNDPILLASPEGRSRLLTEQTSARLSVKTNAALTLERIETSAAAWHLEADAGDLLSAGASLATIVQDADTPAQYHFDLDVDALRPGDVPRAALLIPTDWPVSFDRLAVNSTVTFNRVWDITALEASRPQPRQIVIEQVEAIWGKLQIRFAATLDIDATGAASGTVSVQARNWRAILVLAENSGALPPALRPQIEQALSTFAGLTGNPETLDLTLTLRDGLVSLGFLPLGPAPRLILR